MMYRVVVHVGSSVSLSSNHQGSAWVAFGTRTDNAGAKTVQVPDLRAKRIDWIRPIGCATSAAPMQSKLANNEQAGLLLAKHLA